MKKAITAVILCMFIAGGITAQTTDVYKDFTNSLSDFLVEVNDALPDSAVVGGIWSDAYIGQLIGVPPHFGVGVAAGVTRFPIAALADAVELTGASVPVSELILPNFAIEGRIGGFILPFDIGFRFGMLPASVVATVTDQVSIEYINFGLDIRYALVKENLVLPDVSVGAGFYRTAGSIGYEFKASDLTTVDIPGELDTTENLGLDFSTNVIEAKLQVSKSLLLITPYAGLAANYATSTASYTLVNETDEVSGGSFGARVFGGLSFNLAIFKTDIGAMYNLTSGNWGVNLGARLQL